MNNRYSAPQLFALTNSTSNLRSAGTQKCNNEVFDYELLQLYIKYYRGTVKCPGMVFLHKIEEGVYKETCFGVYSAS